MTYIDAQKHLNVLIRETRTELWKHLDICEEKTPGFKKAFSDWQNDGSWDFTYPDELGPTPLSVRAIELDKRIELCLYLNRCIDSHFALETISQALLGANK